MREQLSAKFRARRDVRLRELIVDLARNKKPLRVIDVGGRVAYWRRVGLDFLRQHQVEVRIVNLFESELEPVDDAADVLSCGVADACNLAFPDNSFDLYHANSVIEHVGGWGNMKRYAAEARRVARHYYVQTPNFWFPVEPHFWKFPAIHWLPRPLAAWLMLHFPLAHTGKARSMDKAFAMLEGAQLLTRKQMQFLFPDAQVHSERLFGLAKSFIAIRR